VRIGEIVRSKYVDCSGSFVVHALGASAANVATAVTMPGRKRFTRRFYQRSSIK